MSRFWYPLATPTIGDEEIDAAIGVLRSRQTTMGDKVAEFEDAFARYVDAPYAVMVNSGSSADLLIALALNLDGEAIVPAVTWPTHAWSWHLAGHKPTFCDVDGINATAETIERHINVETSVLSLVHLMGVPCDMDQIMELAETYRLVVTEDCCEALGSTYKDTSVGTFGIAASWSFFFSHHMTTMEGGMVTTADAEVADRVRSMRSHGWDRHNGDRYAFSNVGLNVRPTEVSAAIGMVQLSKLDRYNKLRAENRDAFVSALDGHPKVSVPEVPHGAKAAWFGLPMFVESGRDALATWLEDNGVETRPILAGNLARQEAFDRFDFGPVIGANIVHDHGLYVGLHPNPDSGVEQVAELIAEWS